MRFVKKGFLGPQKSHKNCSQVSTRNWALNLTKLPYWNKYKYNQIIFYKMHFLSFSLKRLFAHVTIQTKSNTFITWWQNKTIDLLSVIFPATLFNQSYEIIWNDTKPVAVMLVTFFFTVTSCWWQFSDVSDKISMLVASFKFWC